MDEHEWLAPADPRQMAEELRRQQRDRPLRYFGLHCCRLAWPAVTDERSRAAIDAAEQRLVGSISEAVYGAAIDAARQAHQDARTARAAILADPSEQAAYYAARALSMSASIATHLIRHAAANGYYEGIFAHVRDALAFAGNRLKSQERTQLLHRMRVILRELAGNPFRPVAFSPEWRTETVVAMARGIYESRDFGAMPILADALQDAGCNSDNILTHCRDASAAHVRGCWVIDLLLGNT